MKHSLIILTAISLSLYGCSPKVPFTQEIRQKYNLSEIELKGLQFYTSHDIVLRRGETSPNEKITQDGTLKVQDGKKVEEIVIKAGTPGVIDQVIDGNRLTIRFEDGANKYIVFGDMSNRNGYYTLMALDWNSGRGKVNYGEKTYFSNSGSAGIYLKFKMKELRRYEKEQKVVKGIKL